LALTIFVAWCASAIYFGQSPLATQQSSQLLQSGAVNGAMLAAHEYWRLLASQFLHVHFLHMLFNAGAIIALGTAVEKEFHWWGLLGIYFVGGTVGQFASVMSYPALISSGASQGLMTLSGAAVSVAGTRIRILAMVVLAIQAALDLYASGAIKIGHSVGFAVGLLIAQLFLLARSRSSK
jgi:rhomboid protease GluP